MKKLTTLLLSITLLVAAANAQHGFTIEYAGGAFHTIDLLTANKTLVGTTINNFGAADFGPNEVLYAINSISDEFYQIDTTNGALTLIGAIIPPVNHIWTGMAFDDVTGIMYGYSSYGIAAGECSLHIIDVTDGSYTLVGTQTTATSIGCIAIDGSGQMYGMNLQASAKIYAIDKTNNTLTLIGNTGQGAAGMGHGMDWSNSEQAMYLTTYNSMTFENTLRIVDLTNGSTTQVGGALGMWTGALAIPGSMALSADFTSDITDVCIPGTVNYTDLSGTATSWSWIFEGGTPASSTDQNPTVTYSTIGNFDVTLEVSDGISTITTTETDYINATDLPAQPDQPIGEVNVCGNEEYTYTTNAVPLTDTYLWEVLPADAGTITSNGTFGIFTSAGNWNGSYTIKVNATNVCGSSTWSQELVCTLNFTPQIFFLTGGGSYCEGGQGLEIGLDGSEVNVDYELYFDGAPTGTIMVGTGNALNFGYHTEGGLYTIWGEATSCNTLMFGESYISLEYLPGAGSQPTGNNNVCAGETADYQSDPVPDATSLVWTLDPMDAGTIIGTGENIQIEWAVDFSGMAYLSVYGTNDCGDGEVSDNLEVTVSELPAPEVMGDVMVCNDEEYIYATSDNAGSTYEWTVLGGDIISPSTTTSEITVLWTTIGPGYIYVTEISAESCIGMSDTLNVEIDECTGIGDNIDHNLNVYPNPARNHITIDIKVKDESSLDLMIVNQMGQMVYFQNITKNSTSHKINIQEFPTGLYFIKIITSSGSVYKSKLEVIK